MFVASGERTDERDCTGEEEWILMGDSDMGKLEVEGAFCGVGMGATMGIGGDGFCFNGASDIDRERRERNEQVTNSGCIVSSAGVVCGCSSSSSSRSIF